MGRAYEVRKASIQKTGAAKAKLYSTFAKEITKAAKGNPEVDTNIVLKRVVEKAKRSQVPSDIINRAIEKAKGGAGDDYQELSYEGFGPGSSTLIIKCLTDNVNRTVSFVREAFNKCHKSLGVTNSVSYNYEYQAVIGFKYDNSDEVFEKLLLDKGKIYFKTDNLPLFEMGISNFKTRNYDILFLEYDYQLSNDDYMSEYERKFRMMNIPIYRAIAEVDKNKLMPWNEALK